MNAIQVMIEAAKAAAEAKATTVAQIAAEKAAATTVALEKELEGMKEEFEAEWKAPRKTDLLEKEGKLELVLNKIQDRLTSLEMVVEAKVASLDMISAYVQEGNNTKRDLGTAINASAWAIAKAQLEAKGFKLDSRPAQELKQVLMDRAITSTPEIMALVTVKNLISGRVDKVAKARIQVEKDLYYAVKGIQLQVVKLDTLDCDVRFTSQSVCRALNEAPAYGNYRFDFSKKYELFTSLVKEAKEKAAANKKARTAKEKEETAKAIESHEVQMKEMSGNLISLSEMKELKALAQASEKSRNTKTLTDKTFDKARKAL